MFSVGFVEYIGRCRERNEQSRDLMERTNLPGDRPWWRVRYMPWQPKHAWQRWLASLTDKELDAVSAAIRDKAPPFDDIGQRDDGGLDSLVPYLNEWKRERNGALAAAG